jgi:hypothetical protein
MILLFQVDRVRKLRKERVEYNPADVKAFVSSRHFFCLI